MTTNPDTTASSLLELRDVARHFAAVDDADAPEVLRGVHLTVSNGESVAIVGPSGSGKSTLLNIIGGLSRPTRGTVRFDGDDIYAKSDRDLAAFRNRHVGFVFQSHNLLPQCSAIENVLIPTLVHPDDALRADAPKRGRELLERVGLGDRLTHRPGQLSGGECQRVAVVRALINRPRLILADEPTGSLDEDSSDQLADLLAQLNEDDGLTFIIVTHSMALAARMGTGYALRHGTLEPWSAREPAATHPA